MAVFAALSVVASVLVVFGVNPASADGGDIQSIDFAAEDPEEYDHATGGGYYGSDSDGDGKDTVESLQGGDFACGDIVSYFVQLNVQGDGSDDPQTIQLTNTFLADATGQGGAGLTDVVNVVIDPTDPGQSNDGDSSVTVIDEGVDADGAAPYNNDGTVLNGGGDSTYVTYQVDGLETGETVIVRIDVQIECAPNSSPTGNLQGNLMEADIVAINDGQAIEPDAVAGGNQTIPFQKIGELVGAGEPILEFQKTVMAAGGTCGVDDVESLNITVGDTVTYCYLVTNSGTADLENTVISDDNGTPGDTADDFTIAVGTVGAISSTYVTADVTIGSSGTVVNTATATGDGPQNSTLTETDTAEVISAGTPSMAIEKLLTGNADEDASGDVSLGDTLSYTVTATNDGDIALNNVVVSDNLTGDSITCPTVAPGDTCVLSTTYGVTAADVANGSVNNTGTADSDETDPIDDTVDVPVTSNPELSVDKALTANADEDGSGDVSLGDTLTYTVTATNTGDVALTNVVVSDDLTGQSVTCDTVAVGDPCVLTATYVVTAADVAAGNINNTGVADSDETDPVDDTVDVPVVSNPALGVVKVLSGNADEDGSGGVSLGDTLSYTITATNTGDVALSNVTVSDDLTGDSTSCASVAVGDNCVLVVTYVVTQADVDAGNINNTGVADSDETDPVDDTVDVPVDGDPGLAVNKVLTSNADEDGNGEVSLGDTLTYTITASNTGDLTLDITVDDDLTGDSTACADVAPGDNCVLVVTYVVTQADVEAGQISNTAVADSDLTDPEEDTEVVDVPQNPVVDLTKTGSLDLGADGIANPGDVISYTITVENEGNVTLTGVTVSDPGLTGLSCGTDTLAPGESTTCTGTYAITQADIDTGVYNNTASVDSDQDATDTDNHSEPVPQTPGIGVDKVLSGNDDADTSGDVSLGDTLTYVITATNTGNITLQMSVSDDLTGDSTACADVAPGGTCVLTVTYTVDQDDVDAGEVSNTAVADSDLTDPEDDTEVVDVPQLADIDLVKSGTLVDGGDGVANAGDTINYTFDVTNTGNVTLTDVVVTDALLGGTVCTIDSLAPGETGQCSGSYVLTQADIDAGERPNTAEAEGTPPAGLDPDEVVGDSDGNGNPDDPGESIVDIPEAPAIDVTKSGSLDLGADGIANPGDIVSYSLTVTNTGNVTLSNVSVNDPLLGGVVCSFDSLAVDATETCTGTYALTQADIDAGERNNTADASGTSPQGTDVDDDASDNVDVPQIITLSVNKLTNGSDDNTILAGSAVSWTYEVTNTGNTTLTDLAVSDNQGVTVTCPATELAPGESTTCTGSGTAVAGDYTNTGTADADGPQGQDAGDSDDSGYFGADPSFTIDKVTTTASGTGDEEFAVEGDAIVWTYTVENTGNVDLTGIVVTDSVEGAVCTVDVAVGETATCTLDGTAVRGAYANTGIGDSTYTDDVGNSEDLNDTDDSGYTGINGNQPSIQFPERINIEEVGNNGFSTTLNITNESDGLEADTVVLTDFRVIVETGKGRRTEIVDVTCTVNGQAAGDLNPPISFTGASTDLEIECVTADGSALRGSHKITFEAEILNRDRVFSTSTSVRF